MRGINGVGVLAGFAGGFIGGFLWGGASSVNISAIETGFLRINLVSLQGLGLLFGVFQERNKILGVTCPVYCFFWLKEFGVFRKKSEIKLEMLASFQIYLISKGVNFMEELTQTELFNTKAGFNYDYLAAAGLAAVAVIALPEAAIAGAVIGLGVEAYYGYRFLTS